MPTLEEPSFNAPDVLRGNLGLAEEEHVQVRMPAVLPMCRIRCANPVLEASIS
jgi:hypothetical protein